MFHKNEEKKQLRTLLQEESYNKFAHKKGSIASRLNAELATKKNSVSGSHTAQILRL
jgi:hypothetical protein